MNNGEGPLVQLERKAEAGTGGTHTHTPSQGHELPWPSLLLWSLIWCLEGPACPGSSLAL